MRIVAILLAFILSSGSAQARELKLATWNLAWLTLRPAGDPALPPGLVPYDAADLERGFIETRDRRGNVVQFPVMSLSLALVTNQTRVIANYQQIGEVAAELKSFAKKQTGSYLAMDKRKA